MTCKHSEAARQGLLRRAVFYLCAAFAAVGASIVFFASPVQALAGDLAAIAKASSLDNDPQDSQAVAAVCTVCHAASQFLTTPRSTSRWQQVYEQMSGYGATGTDDQLDRVVAYFQKNLTVINVNTSPADDLGPTLQLSDDVVAAVMARRAQHPFSGIDDLSKIAGIDRSILEKLSAKNCLQF
jgi:competence protein ComEA